MVLLTLRWRIVLAFISIYTVWGSTYLAIRFAIQTLPPFLMAATRFLGAGGALYGWTRLRGASRPSRANWKAATIAGGLFFLVNHGAVVNAEQFVPSGLTAVIITTVPLWIALIELTQKERVVPGAQTVLGILLGFSGVAVLVGPGNLLSSGGVNIFWAGILVVGAFAWALGSVYSRKASMPKEPLLGSGMEMLAGGALLLIASLASQEWRSFTPGNVSTLSLVSLLYLVIFGSLIAFSSYAWLLTKTTTAKATTYAYVNPVVAVLIGYFLGGEPLTLRTLIALSMIVFAVAVINTRKDDTGSKKFNGQSDAPARPSPSVP